MVWTDEVGPVRQASRMPAEIVRKAQYMNDAMGSVYGKFTQAVNYQKNAEFRGGIWDCTPVKEIVPSAPSCMVTSNNETNKILSLDEILACDDEDVTCNDTEMEDDMVTSQNEVELSATASCTGVSMDVNNKRWRSEEFDKAILIPCTARETTRKKSKRNVTFSDIVVDMEEDSFKSSAGKISKCVSLDVAATQDVVAENKRMKNFTTLVTENINYVPVEMEDKGCVSEIKSVVNESTKVKRWKKLMLQSDEIDDLPDQQLNEQILVKGGSSNKLLSKQICRNQKTKSNDCIVEQELVLKRCEIDGLPNQQLNEEMHMKGELLKKPLSKKKCNTQKKKSNDSDTEQELKLKGSATNHKVKNEFMNRSHLENAIPELFQFGESITKSEADRRLMKKNLKDEWKQIAEESTNIQNLASEVKETSPSSIKNSLVKGAPSHKEMDLPVNDVNSKTVRKNVLKETESNEDRLKNSLLEMFKDTDIAESITIELKKLAELKKTIDVTEKPEIISGDKQMDLASIINHEISLTENFKMEQSCHGGKFLLEDESQYRSENSTIQLLENSAVMMPVKNCCSAVYEKPYNQLSSEEYGKASKHLMEDMTVETNKDSRDSNSGNVSPTSYPGEDNFINPISNLRSDLVSNWRSQCRDVLLKETTENTTPQNSATSNLRDQCNYSKNQHYDMSRSNNLKSSRVENFKKQLANKMDSSLKIEYEGDDIKVIPLNLKEPPDPISRFKDVHTDPESIWDPREEVKRPSRDNNKIQSQVDSFDSKNGSEAEEHHAQLFRKAKTTSIPRFFDNPSRTFAQSKPRDEIREDEKRPSPRKIDSTSGGMPNENHSSRFRSRQENFTPHRPYERNRSSSAHWGSLSSAISLDQDVMYVIKIANHQDGSVEKLKVIKEDLLEVRGNGKLSFIIPTPGYKPKKVEFCSNALIMFYRCLFSKSYKIPSWTTALEAFTLAKKFEVDDLRKACEDYFLNHEIPPEQIQQVMECAQQLEAINDLKSSKFFRKAQNSKSISAHHVYLPQNCSISCSVFVEPSEFKIPLYTEMSKGNIELCNESDVKNTVLLRSLAHVTCLSGIQLKFLTEDMHVTAQDMELHIICEVFQNKKNLFSQEFDKKAKSAVKITFKDEINIKQSEQVEISVVIEDILLKMCPQLTENQFLSPGKFHAIFDSSKTSEKKKLFCVEKLFYTTSQSW